jgi:hypothetical protein
LTLEFDVGEFEVRLRFCETGLGLVECGLVQPFLDDKEQVALPDVGAFDELALLQKALDPGPQIDLVGRLDAAREGRRRAHLLRCDADHRYGGRRSGRRDRFAFAAAGRDQPKAEQDRRANPVRAVHLRIPPGEPTVRPTAQRRLQALLATPTLMQAIFNSPQGMNHRGFPRRRVDDVPEGMPFGGFVQGRAVRSGLGWNSSGGFWRTPKLPAAFSQLRPD